MNDSLESGTQLPYIKEAIKDGFGVMVLNTNFRPSDIFGPDTAPLPVSILCDKIYKQCFKSGILIYY